MTTVVLPAAAALVLYLLACQIWPYTACKRCQGGKHPSPSGKAWRHCGRCHGTGRRRRLFARTPDQH